MWAWWKTLRRRSPEASVDPIPEALWQAVLGGLPFLTGLSVPEQQALRACAAEFLARKEFHGVGTVVVTDAMALSIATQACLPLLHLAPLRPGRGRSVLDWYDDFVGIVVHAGDVVARREAVDAGTGVVHHYDEVLSGEAMAGGPVMLSWDEVARAANNPQDGTNVVVHEFVHKIVMQGQWLEDTPGFCPPLPHGFLGAPSAKAAVAAWFAVLVPAYEAFREKVIIAERFGGAPTWLDPYGAESIEEFFPVVCEAYFVQRERFEKEFAALMPLLDGFFRRDA